MSRKQSYAPVNEREINCFRENFKIIQQQQFRNNDDDEKHGT